MDGSDATPPGGGGKDWLGDARVAFAFLTRLPLTATATPGGLGAAAWAFPVVGLAVGALAGAVYMVAVLLGLPAMLAAVFAVTCQVMATGALHEDAVADVADGFGGGAEAAQKLDIMRDSRLGTYGAVALVLVLAARLGALAAIAEPGAVFAALLATGALSRAAVVALMEWLAPARRDGLGAGAGRPGGLNLGLALAIAIIATLFALGPGAGTAALIVGAFGAGAVGWLARRQIGGHTGDVLGAGQQGAETLALVTLAALLG